MEPTLCHLCDAPLPAGVDYLLYRETYGDVVRVCIPCAAKCPVRRLFSPGVKARKGK